MRSPPLQNKLDRFGPQKEMDTRTPKATSSNASSLRAERHSFSQPSAEGLVVGTSIDGSPSSWHGSLITRHGPSDDQLHPAEHDIVAANEEEGMLRSTHPPTQPLPTPCRRLDYPEELAQIIMTMSPTQYYDELAEAYREASEFPPITTQSLSELDIQHITTNVRLRHDVNFDRDLSFRPNLDGAKGQQKKHVTSQYWKALEAELELYTRLFQGAPAPRTKEGYRWVDLVHYAQRRIPVMFRTIQEVLKSLVPDRDHARVDEHLDVPMLMQEIQRGVCDLVRLAEWMAQLLKEHCAPMRDGLVDEMVSIIRAGAYKRSSVQIVDGLRELFNILETMKLDVANHQIRNLKTMLIEQTIDFEYKYHLERILNHRSRVNIDTAQAWYLRATWEFAGQYPNQTRNVSQAQLNIFVRAVIVPLFNTNRHYELPETFYLDHDRLRSLRVEIEDLVHIEVCMDAFANVLRQFGYNGAISPSTRHRLSTSLLAIMGNAMGHGSYQWVMNSEALALEILRQASLVAGQTMSISHETLSIANEHLLHMFYSSPTTHHPRLEAALFDRTMICTNRHTSSTPVDLFNTLVPIANTFSPQPTGFSQLDTSNTSTSQSRTLEDARWQDIANRMTHIIILHWRVWKGIAYIQEDSPEARAHREQNTPSPQAIKSTQPPSTAEHETQLISNMKTGESLESGQESLVPHETHFQ